MVTNFKMLSSERNKIAPKDYKILIVRYCQCYILNYHNDSSSLPYSQSFVKKNSVPISQVEFYHLHQFKDNGHYTLTVWYIHVGPEIYQVVCAEISIITFLQKQSSNQIKINTTHHRAVYRESQM